MMSLHAGAICTQEVGPPEGRAADTPISDSQLHPRPRHAGMAAGLARRTRAPGIPPPHPAGPSWKPRTSEQLRGTWASRVVPLRDPQQTARTSGRGPSWDTQ